MASSSDIRKARKLIEDVILVQKNVYIRKLLHDHHVFAGNTKAQFKDRLNDAIEDGIVTLDHLKSWIDETEGWGDEHVYLYRVNKDLCKNLEATAKARIKRTSLAALWNAAPGMAFTGKRKLSSVAFIDGELRFVWHRGAMLEERAPAKDIEPREEVDGETYSYKAYHHFGERTVTRLVVRPSLRLAAVFLPGSSEPATHTDERSTLAAEIVKVFSLGDCDLCSIEKAIPTIEQAIFAGEVPLQTRHTRLTDPSGAGYVEFVSAMKQSYTHSASLLQVRSAAGNNFKGTGAVFFFQMASGANVRDVRVNLHADFQRIRLFVKLSRPEVWQILELIEKFV
jgi:hypothetical protein